MPSKNTSKKVSSQMRKIYSKHLIYKKITHADRIRVIYLRLIHQMSFSEIAEVENVKYNSVRNIVRAYEKHGRTNKKRYRASINYAMKKAAALASQNDNGSSSPSSQNSDSAEEVAGQVGQVGSGQISPQCNPTKNTIQASNLQAASAQFQAQSKANALSLSPIDNESRLTWTRNGVFTLEVAPQQSERHTTKKSKILNLQLKEPSNLPTTSSQPQIRLVHQYLEEDQGGRTFQEHYCLVERSQGEGEDPLESENIGHFIDQYEKSDTLDDLFCGQLGAKLNILNRPERLSRQTEKMSKRQVKEFVLECKELPSPVR